MALSLHRYLDPSHASGCDLNHLLKQRMNNIRERAMSITIAIENGERLPENLLFEILSWLPVKDVLQYKSVCKSWYDFISTPQFVCKHLKNNRYYDENCLLVHCPQLCELYLNQTPRVLANEVLYNTPIHGANIYGPCDGLYFLYCGDFSVIWNPAINEVRTLPPPINKRAPKTDYYPYDCYGFGLDPLSGDYKVVAIKDYMGNNNEIVSDPKSVLVYSLSNDSWKYCGDFYMRYYLKNNTCYIFVKGCCFWLESFYVDENHSEIIITFDMASESIQKIPDPDYPQPARKTLGMYEDSLAFYSVDMDDQRLGIWTLNHGTWTKIFNIGPIPDICYPVAQWKSNKVIFVCEGDKLFLCEPNTREIKNLEFTISQGCKGVFDYMESLVSVKNKIKCREHTCITTDVLEHEQRPSLLGTSS